MALSRLVYFSRNTIVDSTEITENLKRILKSSVRNNSANGLTGGLIFNRTYFVQVLEGDGIELSRTFARISLDAAHQQVQMVGDHKPATARLFGAWSMGFAGRTQLFNQLSRSFCADGIFDPRKMAAHELVSFVLQLVSKESSFVSSPKFEALEV